MSYNKNCDSCYSCDFCDSCEYCYSCDFCDSCDFCGFCDFCESCKSCKSCNSCDFCDSCAGCYNCKNLVNGFRCVGIKLAKKDENKYWIFNKEVTKEEWDKRYDLGFEEKEIPKIIEQDGHKYKLIEEDEC